MDNMLFIVWVWIIIANVYAANDKIEIALASIAASGLFLLLWVIKEVAAIYMGI